MAREMNNRGLRATRTTGSPGFFGISDMYRGVICPRSFRMSRTDLLPTIPSGTEIDETYDISQGASTTHSSDDSIESSDVRRNASTQIRRMGNTDKSPGICQTDDSLISSYCDVFSKYQHYETTNSSVGASTELQHNTMSEKYSRVAKPKIPEIHNPTFLQDSNSSCNETCNKSFVRISTYNNEINRENPTNVGNVQRPISCAGCKFLQNEPCAEFDRKPDAACGAREIFQTAGKNKANERTLVDVSGTGSLYNYAISEVHQDSLHVGRNEEGIRRVVINEKAQTPAKVELNNNSLSKDEQNFGVISYPDHTRGTSDGSETTNNITEGRNQESPVKLNGNSTGSRLQQDPPFSEMPDSRDMQEAPGRQTPANRRPYVQKVAPSNPACSGGANVGCVGTCGGLPARYTEPTCASAVIPRGTGFPKHARMFGASMPYKNKGPPGDVENCGISLLPRVCKTVRSRHDACHRGYTHPIIRTIPGSRTHGASRCSAKTRGKKRSRTSTDAICCGFHGGAENHASCSTYESVAFGGAWPPPTPGDVLQTPNAEMVVAALREESRHSEYEPTQQTTIIKRK